MLVNFDELFPSDIWLEPKQEENDGKNELGSFHICGKDVPRGYWVGTQKTIVDCIIHAVIISLHNTLIFLIMTIILCREALGFSMDFGDNYCVLNLFLNVRIFQFVLFLKYYIFWCNKFYHFP